MGQETYINISKAVPEIIRNSCLQILLPPDEIILKNTYKILQTQTIESEDFFTCIMQDPVLILEILDRARSVIENSPEVNILQQAIATLGAQAISEILDEVSTRQPFEDDNVTKLFETYRHKGRRISIVARIIAEAMAADLNDNCQIAALFSTLGLMLAVANFKTDYVNLYRNFQDNEAEIRDALLQEYDYDIEIAQVCYLQLHNVSNVFSCVYNQDFQAASQGQSVICLICKVALDLVNGFDAGKWREYAVDSPVLKETSVSLLKLPQAQYAKIYERATRYLNATKFVPVLKEVYERENPQVDISNPSAANISGMFALRQIDSYAKPRKDPYQIDAPIPLYLNTNDSFAFIDNLNKSFSEMNGCNELIICLLDELVKNGSFKRSAMLIVSQDRTQAIVAVARGDDIKSGQRIKLKDPHSPIANAFSKILSFGVSPSENSPFGSKTFALSPINANHVSPVMLYADCGDDHGITFESRRIFRTAVDLLNQYLPKAKGSIPNEIEGHIHSN